MEQQKVAAAARLKQRRKEEDNEDEDSLGASTTVVADVASAASAPAPELAPFPQDEMQCPDGRNCYLFKQYMPLCKRYYLFKLSYTII